MIYEARTPLIISGQGAESTDLDVYKRQTEAEAYPGPSLIVAYTPCISHGIKAGMDSVQQEMKRAVDAGYWTLYRYNPAKPEKKFTLDSKKPTMPYRCLLYTSRDSPRNCKRRYRMKGRPQYRRNWPPAPVSYTHLDVYKRQIPPSATGCRMAPFIMCFQTAGYCRKQRGRRRRRAAGKRRGENAIAHNMQREAAASFFTIVYSWFPVSPGPIMEVRPLG